MHSIRIYVDRQQNTYRAWCHCIEFCQLTLQLELPLEFPLYQIPTIYVI